MKKLRGLLLVIMALVVVTACGKKEEEVQLTKVEDENIISIITGHVATIESLPKSIELFKKDKFATADLTNDDYLLYGLRASFDMENNIDLTAQEIEALKNRNIVNVSSYMNISDVESAVAATFGAVGIKHVDTIGECPTFIYDATQSKYYVDESCVVPTERIVSEIDKIEYNDNTYYATVYVGLISGNKAYADVNKVDVVADLEPEQSYVITDENEDKFSKYTFTFTKNSDGNYIFTSVEKKK